MRIRSSAGLWCLAIALGLAVNLGLAQTASPTAIQARWHFKFKQFPIGAWWGPGATDAEMRVYKEAGFNLVMSGRYMQLDNYGDADKGLHELDLARKYGLGVMFDTYTKNNRPWGGQAGPTDPHPTHHPANLAELKWLYNKVGHHPALMGFMIGDDQGSVSQRASDCTDFLFRQPGPQLMPWLCGWIAPANLAEHNNPIADPQIYPTLYQWGLPAEEQARHYAEDYARFSRECRAHEVLFWPMLNTSNDTFGKTGTDAFGYCPSDSLVRFPAYAALAYGAQGLWYFTYNGGAVQHLGDYTNEAAVRKGLTPLYPVVREINSRIAAWGDRVLGCANPGVFGTAFKSSEPSWPFPQAVPQLHAAEAMAAPAPGKLIESMSPDLLCGILTRPGQPPLVMVVDCRVSKNFGDLPVRAATLHFAPAVRRIRVLAGRQSRALKAHDGSLTLEPGGGQMLELDGRDLAALTAPAAIYTPVPVRPQPAGDLTADDLTHLKAAKLRLDVFGSNSGQYRAKYIDLNGHRLAEVPANDVDAWSFKVIDLTSAQLGWISMSNQLTVRTEVDDAWKFRNLTLAVQHADGAWVKTNTDATVYSTPNWAYSEGHAWGADRVAGPLTLDFK